MAKDEAENVRDASAEGGTDKLLSRCGSDAAAFAVLYDIYYEKIFSYCVSRVQIKQVAEDFTSAAFITAAENAYKFGGSKRVEFVNWLYAIATAKINAYLKKRQTIEKLIMPQSQDGQPQTTTWPMLHSAILKRTLREQTVLVLRFFENLAIDRIADITGLRPNNIRREIGKAIENLRICDTEKQFADIVKGLHIDNTPDERHKERLRTRIFVAFNSAKLKKYQSLTYFLAGLIILIMAGFVLWIFSGGKKPPSLLKIIRPLPTATEVNPAPQPVEKTRLEKIKQLAEEKNVAALLEILKGEDLPAKLLAAKFLAELTDTNAAEILKYAVIPKKATAQKPELQKTLLIETIDKKTKQLIADVSIQIKFNDEKDVHKFLTDSNGQYLLALPAESINQLQIRADANGYAPMKMQQRPDLIVPQSILFEMSQGLTIGGLVVDEQLGGIENADVKIRIESGLNPGLPVFDMDEILKTDANGIWRCRNFPQDAGQVSIMITHPDYISQDSFQPVVFEQLKNLSYLTILEKGIVVTGRVLDWENKPMEAVVSRGTNYESRNSTVCDVNGEFRFGNIRAGKEIFTAQCSGASPQILEIDIEPNMPPVIFNLQPAKTIRARVVDINGMPEKDVYVKVSGWQGFETLNFETATDENGFFQWTDAPADEVLFDFYKPGFKPISNFGMKSKNDYVITLETQ
ncbi:MAG: sigma-70 family RNA polymerase sigma factor [Sedimentisphaerales bacterium]